MEYIVSNREFKGSKKKGQLFFMGTTIESESEIKIFEGDIVKGSDIKKDEFDKFFSKEYIGNFNFISYSISKEELRVKNDKFGTYGLYIYHKNSHLIIANNVWNIIKLLKKEDRIVSSYYFKFFLGAWGTNMDGKTLFENVTELNPGFNVSYTIASNKLKVEKYYALEHHDGSRWSVDESVKKLDEDLDHTFSRIKENHPEETVGFGNSGGLDSRLVPIYANQNKIKTVGITMVNKKPDGLLYSITALNAKKIAKIYAFPNHLISHKIKEHDKRMLLDIRNNPFGTAEIIKNPYQQLPEFDVYLTGGNGFIVGGAWNKYLNLPNEKEFEKAFIDYHSKLNAYKWSDPKVDILNKIFNENDKREIADNKRRFYEEHKTKSRISLIRGFHQFSFNKRSPAGGFESINRLYPTYNIYYPIVFENSLHWTAENFASRTILKNLIKFKSKKLYNIPSQNYSRLDGKKLNVVEKVNRRIAMKYRRMGLEYHEWLKEDGFLNYSKQVFSRENDQFYDLLGISQKEFIKLDVIKNLRPLVSLEFLKLKRILDIMVYEEFDFIDDKKLEVKTL